jgi:hypothetical protein
MVIHTVPYSKYEYYRDWFIGTSLHWDSDKREARAIYCFKHLWRLEINSSKTEYVFLSRSENEGQNDNVKLDNKSVKTVTDFKYFRMVIKNLMCMLQDID